MNKKKKQQVTADYDIHEEMRKAKEQMDNAYLNFQNALDPDLIDCYIFEGQAAWKKYRFLMRQANLI